MSRHRLSPFSPHHCVAAKTGGKAAATCIHATSSFISCVAFGVCWFHTACARPSLTRKELPVQIFPNAPIRSTAAVVPWIPDLKHGMVASSPCCSNSTTMSWRNRTAHRGAARLRTFAWVHSQDVLGIRFGILAALMKCATSIGAVLTAAVTRLKPLHVRI